MHSVRPLVNWEKSELVPQQRFDFIGAHFQLDLARVYPTQENCLKVLDKLKTFLKLSSATAREWLSFGQTCGAVPLCRVQEIVSPSPTMASLGQVGSGTGQSLCLDSGHG